MLGHFVDCLVEFEFEFAWLVCLAGYCFLYVIYGFVSHLQVFFYNVMQGRTHISIRLKEDIRSTLLPLFCLSTPPSRTPSLLQGHKRCHETITSPSITPVSSRRKNISPSYPFNISPILLHGLVSSEAVLTLSKV